MPNIKSAKKRVSVTSRQKLENQMVRSQMNTAVKKFNAAISNNDITEAEKLLPITSSKIDNAAVKGVIHKNSANHKKAQIGRALYQLKNGIISIKVDQKTLKQTEQKAAAIKKAAEAEEIRAARAAAKAKKEEAKAPAKKNVKTTAKKEEAKPVAKKATAKKATAKAEEKVETTEEEVK